MTYNTAKAQMKWEYKAELRFKALLQTKEVMPGTEISGIVFGSAMEQLSIWSKITWVILWTTSVMTLMYLPKPAAELLLFFSSTPPRCAA